MAILTVTGCAQVNQLQSRIGEHVIHPSAKFTPAAAAASPEASAGTDASLGTIIDDELQLGHYAAGETALRRYLVQHPDDRAAQAMLHQLTADPEQRLGRASRTHVVQPGDSYSTLAARYLGDASRFLILARYNHSTNPSLLQVGETVRLPVSAIGASTSPIADTGVDGGDRGVASETVIGGATTVAQDAAPVPEPAAAEAKRLQRESVALFDQGYRQQALARLDKALAIEPRLQPSGTAAASLRKDLVTSFHQRAIVLYRDQKLDQAIALWNRVLAIDPNYESAVVYRTRALELKRRLKQF
jgi:tetratricopeptide (TPR) repeat protein